MQKLKNIRKGILDFWQTQVWVIEGQESHSHKTCTLCYAGTEVHKNYIAYLLFKGQCSEKVLGNMNAIKLAQHLQAHTPQYDLAVIEGLDLHRWFYKKAQDFFIPLWLKGTVSIPLKAANRSAKDDLRRIRKYQLTYRLANSQEDYHLFYYKLYKPTMAARHDDRTIAMTYESMLKKLNEKSAQLLLISMDNQPISGTVIRYDAELPTLWSTGILGGNPDYWKTGVTSACYFYCAQYLAEQGHTKMDMGLSRAFLSDGVLQYKKKWGSQFSVGGKRGFILKTNSYTDATTQFLKKHPFVFIEAKRLNGAVVLPLEDITDDTGQYYKSKYLIHGLKTMRLYSYAKDSTNQIEVLQDF